MEERRSSPRNRTLLSGKIVFNSGRSAIDCTIRNLSKDGGCLEVANIAGIPREFHLRIAGDGLRPCTFAWSKGNRIGVLFSNEIQQSRIDPPQTSALIAALDTIEVGIVLLDRELRAQFINRAFRKIWRLPDDTADRKPAFVALMYHGRDTGAYAVESKDLDEYVAHRVALVKEGDALPIDVRLTSGEVLRFHCAALPDGGRMLSYTYVSDIVTHSDELEVLKSAINQADEGIMLLDSDLNAEFINIALRKLLKISDEDAGRLPNYRDLVAGNRYTGALDLSPKELEAFIAQRVARIRAGDPTPQDLKLSDGRFARSKCSALPNGGRMLTFSDITDLMMNARELEKLATTDSLTGLFNRRQFFELADKEWERFHRYQRPLTILMADVDHFKCVNDQFGHATGDIVLSAVANACFDQKRATDVIARIGGEEFAILLPETDAAQAEIVAQRIRQRIADRRLIIHDRDVSVTVSIGIAQATQSMSGVAALLNAADQALYHAKEQGRNRVTRYKPIATDLREAAE